MKPNVIKVIYKVTREIPIELDLRIPNLRRFPVHSQELKENESKQLIFEFDPTSKVDIKIYIEYIKVQLECMYNTKKVEVLNIIKPT